MKRKPVIIFYSEGLNAYLLYSEFIKRHPDLVECLVEFPALPRTKKKNIIKQPMLSRILKRSSLGYIWLNFCTIIVWRFFATLFRNRLKDVARAHNIPVRKYKYLDEEVVADMKALAPDWIINGAPNILKKNILEVPQFGVLNYHGAPLPEYRGAGNYFWMLCNKEKSISGTLHYVDEGLDTGDIILRAEDIDVTPIRSVFQLWYATRMRAFSCFEKMVPYFEQSRAAPAFAQDDTKAETRSLPGNAAVSAARRNGYSTITLTDLFTIIRIAVMETLVEVG